MHLHPHTSEESTARLSMLQTVAASLGLHLTCFWRQNGCNYEQVSAVHANWWCPPPLLQAPVTVCVAHRQSAAS